MLKMFISYVLINLIFAALTNLAIKLIANYDTGITGLFILFNILLSLLSVNAQLRKNEDSSI
jgi:hypothetical protein